MIRTLHKTVYLLLKERAKYMSSIVVSLLRYKLSCMMLHFVALTLCRGKRSMPSVHRSPVTKQQTDRQQTDQPTQAGTTPAPAKDCGKQGGS